MLIRMKLVYFINLIVIAIVLNLLIVDRNLAIGKKYSCNYTDTVNMSEALRLKDGSYSFEGLHVPANLTAEYKVKVIDGIEYSAPAHIRGCVCLLKPCITFCCPHDMRFDLEYHNCVNQTRAAAMHTKLAHVEVTHANGSISAVNILENFVIRFEMGCNHKYTDNGDGQWQLYENGTVGRIGGRQTLFSTDEYCFTPVQQEKGWTLAPLTCERFQRGFRIWIYAICIETLTLPTTFKAKLLCFLGTFVAIAINIGIVTILLMKSYSAFKDKYENLVIFYLIMLIIGLTLLGYLALKNPLALSEPVCKTIGLITYCVVIFSFMLLIIMSYEFWRKFARRPTGGWHRVVFYLVAIFLTVLLQFAVQFAQDSRLFRYLKPGIGDVYCWFDMRLWGILLYYYLPILLMLGICIGCCVKAYQAKQNVTDDTLNNELRLAKSNFTSFVVYLLATCCVWLREVFVFLLAHWREHYFIIDFWSGICVLGLAVVGLVCFVCRNTAIDVWCQNRSENEADLPVSIDASEIDQLNAVK